MSNLVESEARPVPLWQEVHGRIFSTPQTRWWDTYLLWTRIFSSEGWTDEQLVSAVYRVAQRRELPRFAPDHLQAIRDELFGLNSEARARHQQTLARVSCGLCSSTGMVCGLPNPEDIFDGRWVPRNGVHYQIAVCCHCPRGQAKKSGIMSHWSNNPAKAGKCPMEWDEYNRINPNWQTQIEIKNALRDAEIKARGENLPTDLNGIRKRVEDAFAV